MAALSEAGGSAPFREVLDAVGRKLKDDFLPADLERLDTGGIRWHTRLQFVRLRLVKAGLLDANAPRGIWALSPAGATAAKEGRGER